MRCGQFTHELIDLTPRKFNEAVIVRGTIRFINHRDNTMDVELGNVPIPAPQRIDELVDTDCPLILPQDGDYFSDDEQRRVLANVPIFYHCQNSTGTENELKTGHMAFKVPEVEFTHPPWTQATVDERHSSNIRERVYVLYIPPTTEEYNNGGKGLRYIIGHSDLNDIAPCKSEYICMRLCYNYNFRADIPEYPWISFDFGWAKYDEVNFITIIDPILGKVYDGLSEWGITFPCSAKSIYDKVQSVLVDGYISPTNIAFLDKLYSMNAVYDQSFFLQEPNTARAEVGMYEIMYYPTVGCHTWFPTRLCWLSFIFDMGLQCEIASLDPRTFQEPCGYATMGNSLISTDVYRHMLIFGERYYEMYVNGDYEAQITDGEWVNVNIPNYTTFDNVLLNVREYEDEWPNELIYSHDVGESGFNNKNLQSGSYWGFSKGWVTEFRATIPLEISYSLADSYSYYEGEWSREYGWTKRYMDVSLTWSFYCPWMVGVWHTDDFTGHWEYGPPPLNEGHYSGFPLYQPYPTICGESYMVGISAMYAISVALYFYDGFTQDGHYGEYTFTSDKTMYKTKVSFAYNPNFWKGLDHTPGYDRSTTALVHLPGVSAVLEAEVVKMYEAYRVAWLAKMIELYPGWEVTWGYVYASGMFSSFIMRVVD